MNSDRYAILIDESKLVNELTLYIARPLETNSIVVFSGAHSYVYVQSWPVKNGEEGEGGGRMG